ncbi:MAG: hypothetical protein U0838_10480 [Chloroflexota bacterium]
MTLVRTNITLPEDLLAQIDAIAGPRGRSKYIADVVAKQVRRDNLRRVINETAGVLRGSSAWGDTDEERDANLRAARDSWDRDESVWGEDR